MKLDLSEDQGMTGESFVRFLDEQSSVARVRATLAFESKTGQKRKRCRDITVIFTSRKMKCYQMMKYGILTLMEVL